MIYLFYITVGGVLGFFILGPIGAFLGAFLGFLYSAGGLQRKKNEELEKEIYELKNGNK